MKTLMENTLSNLGPSNSEEKPAYDVNDADFFVKYGWFNRGEGSWYEVHNKNYSYQMKNTGTGPYVFSRQVIDVLVAGLTLAGNVEECEVYEDGTLEYTFHKKRERQADG